MNALLPKFNQKLFQFHFCTVWLAAKIGQKYSVIRTVAHSLLYRRPHVPRHVSVAAVTGEGWCFIWSLCCNNSTSKANGATLTLKSLTCPLRWYSRFSCCPSGSDTFHTCRHTSQDQTLWGQKSVSCLLWSFEATEYDETAQGVETHTGNHFGSSPTQRTYLLSGVRSQSVASFEALKPLCMMKLLRGLACWWPFCIHNP